MDRRQQARALRDEGLLLREIGERMGGISRERVRQLLSPVHQTQETNLCRECGKEIVGHPARKYCREPCLPMEERPRMTPCIMCGRYFKSKQGKRYCGRPCPYKGRIKLR